MVDRRRAIVITQGAGWAQPFQRLFEEVPVVARVVIAKKRATREWLRGHLRAGVKIDRWLWVTAGEQTFPAGGRTNLRLAQAGIRFAGRKIRAKHLG